MKTKYKLLGVGALLMGLSSCSDFLSQVPDDRTVIDSYDAVKELLVAAYPSASYMAFAETMSDNAADKGPSALKVDYTSNEQAYFWKEQTSTTQDTYTYFWTQTYNAIAHSNQALASIEELGDGPELKPLKGEALVTRAYNHFMLVNVFAENYGLKEKNESLLGIPYVLDPENKVFVNYVRETIAKTYELIEKDLLEGLPLISDKTYSAKAYHFTKDAANTFASRFFLFKGDWEKVIEYADKVLISNFRTRFRPWNSKYLGLSYQDLETNFTSSDLESNLLLSATGSLFGRFYNAYSFGATIDILRNEILNSPVPNLAFKYYGSSERLHTPKFKEYFKLSSINATTGHPYIMAPLIVLEEALFNRAEAYAMLGNTDAAVNDINAWLSTRVEKYQPGLSDLTLDKINLFYKNFKTELNPFYEITDEQRPLLNCIIDFRRKEFLQEGSRWFDVKRFHIEVTRRAFMDQETELDVLTKDDLRRAIQVPQEAMSYGIVPNPR